MTEATIHAESARFWAHVAKPKAEALVEAFRAAVAREATPAAREEREAGLALVGTLE